MRRSDAKLVLEELGRGIRVCRRCPLHLSRGQAVPGEGNPRARVMLVGEAPGKAEDREGRPFVGRAGRFLDALLASIDLPREDIFITSSVKCRPPHNRTPRPAELETCKLARLEPQISAVDPVLIVLMGSAPLRQVFGDTARLRDVHGTVRTLDGRRFLVTHHPAAGMRFPDAGAAIRRDFGRLKRLLAATHRGKSRPP